MNLIQIYYGISFVVGLGLLMVFLAQIPKITGAHRVGGKIYLNSRKERLKELWKRRWLLFGIFLLFSVDLLIAISLQEELQGY